MIFARASTLLALLHLAGFVRKAPATALGRRGAIAPIVSG
jgi:hypothetical protein